MSFLFTDFDNTFVASQNNANEALENVNRIDEMIRTAMAKSMEAQQAMQVWRSIKLQFGAT